MATLTITTTTEQDQRIVVAFGKFLNLQRNATAEEIKQWLVKYITSVVLEEEKRAARAAAVATIEPITPT